MSFYRSLIGGDITEGLSRECDDNINKERLEKAIRKFDELAEEKGDVFDRSDQEYITLHSFLNEINQNCYRGFGNLKGIKDFELHVYKYLVTKGKMNKDEISKLPFRYKNDLLKLYSEFQKNVGDKDNVKNETTSSGGEDVGNAVSASKLEDQYKKDVFNPLLDNPASSINENAIQVDVKNPCHKILTNLHNGRDFVAEYISKIKTHQEEGSTDYIFSEDDPAYIDMKKYIIDNCDTDDARNKFIQDVDDDIKTKLKMVKISHNTNSDAQTLNEERQKSQLDINAISAETNKNCWNEVLNDAYKIYADIGNDYKNKESLSPNELQTLIDHVEDVITTIKNDALCEEDKKYDIISKFQKLLKNLQSNISKPPSSNMKFQNLLSRIKKDDLIKKYGYNNNKRAYKLTAGIGAVLALIGGTASSIIVLSIILIISIIVVINKRSKKPKKKLKLPYSTKTR
jgi:hypothetical protein